jgi:thymidylate synthase
MQVIRVRNINQAWDHAKILLNANHTTRPSRVGEVIEYPDPVTTVYEKPCERVLFNEKRNANCFFNFMEAMHMLAGRNDVCLAADTIVNSPEGNIPLSTLSNKFASGEISRYPVYAVDVNTGSMQLKWCVRAWKTGEKPVRELLFDDGSTLRATKNHLLYLRKTKRGKTKTASEAIVPIETGKLVIGDRVWAPKLYGKRRLTMKFNILRNTAFSNVQMVHRAYAELINSGPVPAGYDIHHVDENPLNNKRENLQVKTKALHQSEHMRSRPPEELHRLGVLGGEVLRRATGMGNAARWADPEQHRHASEVMKRLNAEGRTNNVWTPERRKQHSLRVSKNHKEGRYKNVWTPKLRKAQSERASRPRKSSVPNHKIVGIRDLPPEAVYDLAVEDFHTVLVGTGVLVHNCWIERFNSKIRDFIGNVEVQHGAYGYRWRKFFDMDGGAEDDYADQILKIIRMLKKNPDERRAVLTMWSPLADLERPDLADVPCNLICTFKIRGGALDMIVFCRSNDIVFGAYSANQVHFSFLLEYMASMIGVPVGRYFQISDSWHAYTSRWSEFGGLDPTPTIDRYALGMVPFPLVDHPETWDEDLKRWMERDFTQEFSNRFFSRVAEPMWLSWSEYKHNNLDNAIRVIRNCDAADWRWAGTEWLLNIQRKRAEKGKK